MRRSLAVSTVTCLSLLGAGVAISAGSGPAVGASPVGVTGGPVTYGVASQQEAYNYLYPILSANLSIDQIAATQWFSSILNPHRVVVLAGDSVTWYEGIGFTESGGDSSYGPDQTAWALDMRRSQFTATRAVLVNTPDSERVSPFDPSLQGCATEPRQAVDAETLINAWCYGALYYNVTINDLTAADSGKRWTAGTYDVDRLVRQWGMDHNVAAEDLTGPSGVNIVGPSEITLGTMTAEEYVYVLDPKLELKKDVCISTVASECDPTVDADWTDSQEIPQGSANAIFRITVTNTGNVDLLNVHIAEDTLKPAAGDTNKVGTPTLVGGGAVNGAAFVPSTLTANGGTASLVITVPLTGDLTGKLVNVATANGDLPSTIPGYNNQPWPTKDPKGQSLINRFRGNPEPGNPAPNLVPSNEDQANVYEPYPAIALEKWVCQAGTGCTTPTGADLDSLGAGTPAGGWVKATTVPMSADAQWLLVVTNTGTVDLADVTLSREDFTAGGDEHGATSNECAVGTDLGTLTPGQSTTVLCTTAEITSTAAWDSGQSVVNTAQASGTPVGEGVLGYDSPPVVTAESSAQVNTETLADVLPGPPQGSSSGSSPTVKLPLLGATGANAQGAALVAVALLLAGTALVVTRKIRARRLTS